MPDTVLGLGASDMDKAQSLTLQHCSLMGDANGKFQNDVLC